VLTLQRLLFVLFAAASQLAVACNEPVSVCEHGGARDFPLIHGAQPASILIDADADPAVRHVAASFASDLERVSGHRPAMPVNIAGVAGSTVIIGVLGQSPVIDGLARAGKIDAADIAGHWEAFRQIVVEKPFANVPHALVIVGADRRGAVFGTYDLSQKIGVSPWYWFADVPVPRRDDVFITSGSRRDEPRVKYRGFFINDEDPAFNSWARRRFGGINSELYAHVFELGLRLKGNILWPAMWRPKAFFEDDPRNMVLADEMGMVIGTSHHEPMMRAHDEWHRHTEGGVTGGKWDYATNAKNLRTFWRGGIERMMSKDNGQPYESLVTIGMRGDGDEPMGGANAQALLQTVVEDQRNIIAEVTHKPADQIPQVWALYKEVQDYYDHGMQVPDDVILLFSDDNWGQIRRLPPPGQQRRGGFGVYYHFDYVGAPRNYKWLNTNQIEKVWQQMDLAYARGARALWMVNVGDIKPMEFPLSFWMDMAWNPERMTVEALAAYPEGWARANFGAPFAKPIGELITTYSRLAARRKPELLDANSFPLDEFGRLVAEWQKLEQTALALKRQLPKEYQDAYFELVEHPISALSNLYAMYYAAAKGSADQLETAFRRDAQITAAYHAVAGGKWDGMMSQVHIGYTSWNDPPVQQMPNMSRVSRPAKPAQRPLADIEAVHFTRALGGKGEAWRVIPSLGVVGLPQGQPATTVADNVRLDYDVTVAKEGDARLLLDLAPTLDTDGSGKIRIGVSIDDSPVQTLTSQLVPTAGRAPSRQQRDWVKAVSNNLQVLEAPLPHVSAGKHTIKIWRLDDNVVLRRLVLSSGAPRETTTE
jgi:hypothetical protein